MRIGGISINNVTMMAKGGADKRKLAAGVTAATMIGVGIDSLMKDNGKTGHFEQVGFETDANGVPLDSPIGFVPKMEWTDNPTLLQRIKAFFNDIKNIDPGKAPDWADPSKPFLTDKNGIPIIDEMGYIDNPWYNPEVTGGNIVEAVASGSTIPISAEGIIKDASGVPIFSPLDMPIPSGNEALVADTNISDPSSSGISLNIPDFDPNGMPIPGSTDISVGDSGLLGSIIDGITDLIG